MKPLRSTGILLVLALVGGAYLYWAERAAPSRSGNLILLSIAPDRVQRVRFSPSGVAIRRHDKLWKAVSTQTLQDVPADPEGVKLLLTLLEKVESSAPVNQPEKLAIYGLEPPAAKIEVDGKVIFFGQAPRFAPDQVYARTDAGIALVPATLLQSAQKSLLQWRDKAVLRLDAPPTAFSIQKSGVRADFTKNGDVWRMTPNVRASGDAIGAFLAQLEGAQVSDWLDESGEQSAKYGLTAPRAVLSSGNARLEIGARQKSGAYAARNSASRAIFLLPDTLVPFIERPFNSWRDPRLAFFETDSIARLEIGNKGRVLTLIAENGGWRQENGKVEPKMRVAALETLDWARRLRGVSFVSDSNFGVARHGLNAPDWIVKGYDGGGALAFELRFGQVGETLYAQSRSGTSPGELSTSIWKVESTALDQLKKVKDDILGR